MKRRNFFKVIPVLALTPLVVVKAIKQESPKPYIYPDWVEEDKLLTFHWWTEPLQLKQEFIGLRGTGDWASTKDNSHDLAKGK